MTTKRIKDAKCPACEGDLQFNEQGLDGATIKCLQCSRVIPTAQAIQLLVALRLSGQSAKAKGASEEFRQAA